MNKPFSNEECLEGLGVSVKSQETLENDVMCMIDERIREKEKDLALKQVKKELGPLVKNLRLAYKKKSAYEREIRKLHEGTFESSQRRKITLLIDDQESSERHLEELFSKQNTLLQRLKDVQYNYEEDPDIVPFKPTESPIDEKEPEEEKETELQRNIRLGEVTAFGTSLQTKSSEGSRSTFQDYIQQQISNQNDQECIQNNIEDDSGFIDVLPKKIKRKNAEAKAIASAKKLFKRKKRPKLVDLGTSISSDPADQHFRPEDQPGEKVSDSFDDFDDDPDWNQSDNEDDEEETTLKTKRQPKKNSKKQQREVFSEAEAGFATDDSDWEGTDDDDEPKKRKKNNQDDGDRDLYVSRISDWESNRTDEEMEMDGKFEELEGGLKVPSFLWNRLYNYQKVGVQWMFELHQQGCGGILGDEMGLGKTIQVAVFLASLSYSKVLWKAGRWRGLGPTIIVCPTTVIHQWVRELHKWWPPLRVAVLHFSGSHTGSKTSLVRSIHSALGILVMSYQAVASNIEQLSSLDWHYVILDEGHKIRNPDAKVTLAVKQVATPHRLILSGSPMQNNLKELWSLFDFIYPGKLGTLPVFIKQFSGPITAGGYATANTLQVATAYKCATVLKDTINPYLLRRMKEDVKKHINLPEKNEQVLFCRLTEEQRSLYRSYIDGRETKSILEGHLKVFVGLIALRKICNHPDLFTGGPRGCEEGEEEGPDDKFGWYKRSGKMVVVHSLLKLWGRQGHRVLLFSQSRQMVKVLESHLVEQGYSYLRMDGMTAVGSRQGLIEKFNNDPSIFVFILTTKVGGLGVNLTGADRIIIFDPDWNPSTDLQARERAWRIGQEKQVTIYRLMMAGTIEEKIYHRQIFKQFLVNRVLKDPKQRRFFKSNDLHELFTLTEATEGGSTETSAIFAGTGSEVRVESRKRKRSEEEIVPVIKPGKRRKTEVDGAAKDVKKSLKRLYNEDGVDAEEGGNPEVLDICDNKFKVNDEPEVGEIVEESSKQVLGTSNRDVEVQFTDEIRNRLREQARRISAKFSSNSNTANGMGQEQQSSTPSHPIPSSESSPVALNTISSCHNESKGSSAENREISPIPLTLLKQDNEKHKKHKHKHKEGKHKHKEDKHKYREEEHKQKENEHQRKKDKHQHKKNKHKHHKDKHSKHKKDGKFEGQRLPNLVKCRQYKPSVQDQEEQDKTAAHQDNYVLAKLMAKSGVHSAVQHEAIVDADVADYAILESEANETARRAVRAMKDSRQQCMRAEAGVPNWTGSNGGLGKLKFGSRKKKKEGGGTAMSSSELLGLMRSRNALVPTVPVEEEGDDLFRPDSGESSRVREDHREVEQTNMDLLTDIRNFIAFQAEVDGVASTSELVGKFKRSLPSQQSPLFKALLQQICDFRRELDGRGLWSLKEEFR